MAGPMVVMLYAPSLKGLGLALLDLRHTFASHLVMNGVDIKTVQELLGHASLAMTLRYSHLAPTHRTRAVQVLDSAYQSDTKTDTIEILEKRDFQRFL